MEQIRTDKNIMRGVFFLASCVSVGAVALICAFMFGSGVPTIVKIGVKNFLLGRSWKPELDVYGILPMIAGSAAVTALALLLGVPCGILAAVFLARFCPAKIYPVLKSGVDLLAGIPSVVYGFCGLTLVVPLIRSVGGGSGASILAASAVLAVMILPTIVGVSEAAIRAVPASHYEGSLALGACKERSVFFVELPAAKSGIVAAIILGVGRAVGETMAVIMVAGNQAVMPRGILKGARTLTANIVLEMGYATGLHRDALIATAVVLFFFILIINFVFMLLRREA